MKTVALPGVCDSPAIGAAKTGLPGLGSFVAPLMVLTVGDARYAAAWTLPILSTADVFAVLFWRKHADARKLFSLVPWVAAGMIGGAYLYVLKQLFGRKPFGRIQYQGIGPFGVNIKLANFADIHSDCA